MDPNDVIKGVYSKFTGSALQTALGGLKLFYKNVPQTTALPYADVDIATIDYDENFNEEGDIVTLVFRVFDDDRSDCGDLCDTLTQLFDNCVLTVSGWRHIYFSREFIQPIDDFENMQAPIFGWVIQYAVYVEQNK